VRRRIAPVAVALLLFALVAMAAADGDGPNRLRLPRADWQLEGIFTAVMAVVMLIGLVAIVAGRPGLSSAPRRQGPLGAVLAVVIIVLALGAAALFARLVGRGVPTPEETTSQPVEEPSPLVDVEAGDAGVVLLTLLAVGAVVVLGVSIRTRARGRPAPLPPEEEVVGAAIERSLATLPEGSAEARAAILACWRVLEDGLRGSGSPRGRHETAAEYLDRVIGPLDPPPEPLARFAGRVERARWSTQPLHADDVEICREALLAVLAHLRLAA
jgi:Domain of unknown function (DUF4129)